MSQTTAKTQRRRTPNTHHAHLRMLTATLRGNLEKCAANPNIDPVHDVRTGTRRVQAMVEAILRERSGDVLHEAAGKWLQMLKKIRRAAAPVRDLDVHRKLLRKLTKYGSKEEGAGMAAPGSDITGPSPNIMEAPASELPTNPVEHQAEHLDAWLHHARQHHAAALRKKAEKFLAKFDADAAAFDVALQQGGGTRHRPRSAAVVALESFVRLVHEMQQLDAGNLHDFRKGAKKARYIAESAAEDAHAISIGKALKKLQDDIGDWHDWFVLADEARTALGDDSSELIALLDTERDRHYVLAMKTVSRIRGKLLGEWLAVSQPRRRSSATAHSSR